MVERVVQVGTVRLPLHGDISLPTDWRPLTSDLLETLSFNTCSTSSTLNLQVDPCSVPSSSRVSSPSDLCAALSSLSISRPAGFHATGRPIGSDFVIRIYLQMASEDVLRIDTKEQRLLRHLFAMIDRSWDGEMGSGALLSQDQDIQGMQDVYALITSPPRPTLDDCHFPEDQYILEALSNYETPKGVRTKLHQYQMRSIARMMKMEAEPEELVDPSYVQLTEAGQTDRHYFIDFDTMNVQSNPNRFALPKGGILCEQMGSGKTIMCLSLVLATLHQPLNQPFDPYITPITTDKALHDYPTSSQQSLRDTLCEFGSNVAFSKLNERKFPTLASICADLVVIHRPDVKKRAIISPSVEAILQRNPIYFKLPKPSRLPRAVKETRREEVHKMMVMNTTLIVVPAILVPQWEAEASKHFEEDVLRIHVVPDSKEQFPRVEELVDCDIILMSLERFKREYKGSDPNRIFHSELRKARWKRIILDEGNNAGSSDSDAMRLVASMSIERRWIVSGTPTTGLKQGTEDAIKSFLGSEVMQRPDSESPLSNFKLSNRKESERTVRRQWSKLEINDANRLCNMIQGFLGLEAFQAGKLRNLLLKPLRKRDGPQFGAVAKMSEVIPGEIDEAVKLPPLQLSATMLTFDSWQRLTYNALMALVASNVYTSEGEDVDYLLHPRNKEHYYQVVENLHYANSWYCSRHMDLEKSIERTKKYMDRKQNLSPILVEKLNEAIGHMRAALDTPVWVEWMSQCHASIPYIIQDGLSDAIKDAWSDSLATGPEYIDAHSLRLIQEAANIPGITAREITMMGWDERASKCEEFGKTLVKMEKEWRTEMGFTITEDPKRFAKSKTKAETIKAKPKSDSSPSKSKLKSQQAKNRNALLNNEESKLKLAAGDKGEIINVYSIHQRKSSLKKLAGQTGSEKNKIDAKLDEASQNAVKNALVTTPISSSLVTKSMEFGIETLPFSLSSHSTPVSHVIKTKSRSTKINHIVHAIQSAHSDDKFVIFGKNQELAHLNEALDLIGVEATCVVAGEDKKLALQNFHKPEIKVCMLDLKVAARGLDLTIANRMIFFSPLWSLDVQAQAIKRIHRIGQKRETKIEILVSKGTFEEDIILREGNTRSKLEEDNYTRALIENPRFVKEVDQEDGQGELFEIRMIKKARSMMETVSNIAEPLAAIIPTALPLTPSSAFSNSSSLEDSPLLIPATPGSSNGAVHFPYNFQDHFETMGREPSTPTDAPMPFAFGKDNGKMRDREEREGKEERLGSGVDIPRVKKRARFVD